MKTTKKLLSILLAVLMLLSLASAAAATGTDDGYNWKPIPTSSKGLKKGDYYLDWTEVAKEEAKGDQALADRYLAILNAGEFFFDEDKAALKGSYTMPADLNCGIEEVWQLNPNAPSVPRYLQLSLKQVGMEWKPVSLTGENLKDGDYYLDYDAYIDAYLQADMEKDIANGTLPADTTLAQYWEKFRADEIARANVDTNITMEAFRALKVEQVKHDLTSGNLTCFVNPLDSKLLKVKLVEPAQQSATGQTEEKTYIYPLDPIAKGEYTGYVMAFIAAVKQYKAPGTTPEEPQPDPNMCHWCGQVHEGFFQKIIGFFHNILAKIFGNKY